ncbi:hypothetical protein [Methylomonas sp. MgM2]
MTASLNLLTHRVTVIWIAMLASVLVFHCGHLIHRHGQHRWFHGAHIVMLLGMLYMYASMAFAWKWIPARAWMSLFAFTTAAIFLWMIARCIQRRKFSYLWILALIQQAAMVYMWMPVGYWIPWLSYSAVGYFTLETIGWLIGLCNDARAGRSIEIGFGGKAWIGPLIPRTVTGNISMAVMAASMGYMFAAMQLML